MRTGCCKQTITAHFQGHHRHLLKIRCERRKRVGLSRQSFADAFLRANVDPDEIDRTGEIPDEVIEGLAKLGAFGIKISPQLGGLGLSQTNYCRAAVLLGSYCSNLAALLLSYWFLWS